jgi:Bardet-Biedl syndrome 1 protein
MDLCDLYGDGDGKLVIADLGTGVYNMKLKVLFPPIFLCTFLTNTVYAYDFIDVFFFHCRNPTQVYKGTSLMTENTLVDLPTAVATFQMETTQPRVPGKDSITTKSS